MWQGDARAFIYLTIDVFPLATDALVKIHGLRNSGKIWELARTSTSTQLFGLEGCATFQVGRLERSMKGAKACGQAGTAMGEKH